MVDGAHEPHESEAGQLSAASARASPTPTTSTHNGENNFLPSTRLRRAAPHQQRSSLLLVFGIVASDAYQRSAARQRDSVRQHAKQHDAVAAISRPPTRPPAAVAAAAAEPERADGGDRCPELRAPSASAPDASDRARSFTNGDATT